jgi:uncharacterized protein
LEVAVRITVEELELHPIVVSQTFTAGTLDYHGTSFRQAAPLKVDAVAELVGSEIHIRGRVGTSLEACCDRCLGSVAIPVERDFDLFYRPVSTIARAEEVALPKDELDIGFFSGNGIELADVVTEQVILSVPMKVVCQTDCRGLCPVCGANLNLEKCGCLPTPENSPFSFLKKG